MPKKLHLLLAEDEPTLAYLIVSSLEEEGYKVTHVTDGDAAVKSFYEIRPDLIILDVMMPKLNGYKVAKSIRATEREVPIIFLTAKVQSRDVVKGFESGANDYIRKPFAMEELLIRIKALLLKGGVLLAEENQFSFEIGDYLFNSKKQELLYKEELIKLTSKESDLLQLLCENKNRLLPKANILFKVWKDDSFYHSRSLDVFISRLRKYLNKDSKIMLMNVRGEGYKLIV